MGFSPWRRKTLATKLNILISFSDSHESNNEDPDSNSVNEAYSKKVGEKNKIIKDGSYGRYSNRPSTERYLSCEVIYEMLHTLNCGFEIK